MMALAVLEDEPRRFNDIKRRLEGVTQRVLTHTLRRLERNGMVERRVLPTSPVGVEYALTPLGRSLREPFWQLLEWTLEHSGEVERARRAYDGER
ncbi:helix-turn-helix transcriptional regulator [Actinosynnema pretiosum subsp. pretiosum]|nr:helix-turn-helix transcriptional regulator [Actinosynnema pretiosum subsp. pretiosum]